MPSIRPIACDAARAGARCSVRLAPLCARSYRARPASRHHVQHLGDWYAQSHPTEDFAETFAVWLQPRSGWRRRYAAWPALRKLELRRRRSPREIGGHSPPVRSRDRIEPLDDNQRTLARALPAQAAAPSAAGIARARRPAAARVFARPPSARRRALPAATLLRAPQGRAARACSRDTRWRRPLHARTSCCAWPSSAASSSACTCAARGARAAAAARARWCAWSRGYIAQPTTCGCAL